MRIKIAPKVSMTGCPTIWPKMQINVPICRTCGVSLNLDNWHPSNLAKNSRQCKICTNKESASRAKLSLDRDKTILFTKMGGECNCCGLNDLRLLSVDHIYNDGAQDRKEKGKGSGSSFYRFLLKNEGYLSRVRLLCYNCNGCLGHHGYCPHQGIPDRTIATTDGNFVDGQCRICKVMLDEINQYKHHKADNKNVCKNCWQDIESDRTFKNKKELIAHYGEKCVECKETQPEFLTIDHINNDGAIDKKNGKCGVRLYRWLKKMDYPQDNYQLLCYNCNSFKEYYIVRGAEYNYLQGIILP